MPRKERRKVVRVSFFPFSDKFSDSDPAEKANFGILN